MAKIPTSPLQAPTGATPWGSTGEGAKTAPAAPPPPPLAETAIAAPLNQESSDGTVEARSGDTENEAGAVSGDVADAQDALDGARSRLAGIAHEKASLDQAFTAATLEVDACIVALEALQPPETTTSLIQDYHARQQEMLADRAARIVALRSSGVDFKALLTMKAPIDSAMSRRTGRGGNRPTLLKA